MKSKILKPNYTMNLMKSKIILVFLSFIFLISFVSAIESDYTFERNVPLNIKHQCYNNGTYCSVNTLCNITISNPNNNNVITNKLMTNNISFYNISIPAQSKFGFYKSDMMCCDGINCASDTFYFELTADGNRSQQFPMEILVMIIGYILLILGITTIKKNLIQYIASAILIITGTITLYPGYSYIDYSTLLGFTLGVIGIGTGFYFLFENSFSYDKQVEKYDQYDTGEYDND